MAAGDAAYIKKINRSLIVQKIIERKMISRADLSKLTSLTRATISAQAADLLEDELIVETHLEHHGVGRRPIMLSVNRSAGYTLGIDLDYGLLTFALSDLLGQPVSTRTVKIEATEYETILHLLVKHIQLFEKECAQSRYGLVGVVIGIHGLVTKDEIIHYVPRFGWRDIHIKNDLEKATGLPICIENNANLCSFAERVYEHHETENLLCASLYSGIGLGVMMNEEFFKGHDGFAGEVGHTIIMPNGKPCNCGNYGCWEQYASESSFFRELSEKKGQSTISYEDVHQWMQSGDKVVVEMMEQFIYFLTIGLNNLINAYNPEVIVLSSELLQLNPQSIEQIECNLKSTISQYRELSISKLGTKACVLGACALGIKHFWDVPSMNLSLIKSETSADITVSERIQNQ
ncbi:ROK family protein [Domibacillus aminovorans]|uniref:ROK family protein n=1 Tax=Domibacillus aminovorans TaxID=29332 RepID=A0A177L0J0_9BACI|nr:ROK family protein [Domibacillus aminovorans]OAH58926.1 ROK family protein [Domibacillus aminovorans]